MKGTVVALNSYNYLSTGNIMLGISKCAREHGYQVYTFSPQDGHQKGDITDHRFMVSRAERGISVKLNTVTGNEGAGNYFGTAGFLKELDRIKPDVLHLHNLHSNYVNLNMLFSYIKKNRIQVVWTLHDCWPFTGHCPHFLIPDCEKWKKGCFACPVYREYPISKRDNSKKMYERKKEWFTGVENMHLVSPSRWLKDLVGQSFLREYPIQVIENGIDLNVFQPTESDIRSRYHLEDAFILLGVAAVWGPRKGLDRIEALAENLDDRFQIVLIGIEKDRVKSDKILCISKTRDQEELARWYTAADVLFNPTREDNFPTVNLEALACGTPILTYGAGGSGEAIDEKTGMVVNDDTVLKVLEQLYQNNFSKEDCMQKGRKFDRREKFQEYVDLYNGLLG